MDDFNKNGFIVKKDLFPDFCETINGVHPGSTMSYVIKKKQITQKCPMCKKNTSRTHELTPNVLKVLKQ